MSSGLDSVSCSALCEGCLRFLANGLGAGLSIARTNMQSDDVKSAPTMEPRRISIEVIDFDRRFVKKRAADRRRSDPRECDRLVRQRAREGVDIPVALADTSASSEIGEVNRRRNRMVSGVLESCVSR